MNILLYAPEYRPNLSNMIRTAEFFGFEKIFVYDKNELLEPPKNKATRADMNHMARVWTAGAIEYIKVEKVIDLRSFLELYPGRKIATCIQPEAQLLGSFLFEKKDLLIMGSEKEGLPDEVVLLCDHILHLPSKGHTDCLNVSVSLGIFLYAAQQQE